MSVHLITIAVYQRIFVGDCVSRVIVFIIAENMSCIHNKQLMLGVNENSACYFHIRWNE